MQQSGSTSAGTKLLDKDVSPSCLASLLGIGKARLRKVESGAPDLRYGKRAEPRSSALAWTVDSFLQIAYDRIAETLPDKSPTQV